MRSFPNFPERFDNVENLLASRSMRRLYLAYDNKNQRRVVIKAAMQATEDDPFPHWRIRKEQEALSKLNPEGGSVHPNIIQFYDFLELEPNDVYLCLEHVEGGSLERHTEEYGCLSENDAVRVAIDICDALAHLERHGIIHRDIKPSNILLECNGDRIVRAKLCDFGIAQIRDRTLRSTTLLKNQGFPATPEYMAPEQAEPGALLETRTDIYALGLTLWWMLTETLYKEEFNNSGGLPNLRKYNPHTSRKMARVIQKAAQPKIKDRYVSPQAMREDLEEILKPSYQLTIWLRPVILTAILIVAVIIIVAGTQLLHFGLQPEEAMNVPAQSDTALAALLLSTATSSLPTHTPQSTVDVRPTRSAEARVTTSALAEQERRTMTSQANMRESATAATVAASLALTTEAEQVATSLALTAGSVAQTQTAAVPINTPTRPPPTRTPAPPAPTNTPAPPAISVADGTWQGSDARGVFIEVTVAGGGISSVFFDYPDGVLGPDLAGDCPPDATQTCLGYQSQITQLSRAVRIQSDGSFARENIKVTYGDLIRYLSLSGRFNQDGSLSINIFEENPVISATCLYRTNLSATLNRV